MAGRQGFEPRYCRPEPQVLPLNDRPTGAIGYPPIRTSVKASSDPLLRGFEFKSFTRWVKVYSGIHGLGRPARGPTGLDEAAALAGDRLGALRLARTNRDRGVRRRG